MKEKDIEILLMQIRNIILSKPIEDKIEDKLETKSQELEDLQKVIFYLSNCLSESNEFLKNISIGNLDANPPSKHNFLAGSLKELHLGLKNLVHHTNQVVNGDYKQRLDFMGNFSEIFNEMVIQLEKREKELQNQAEENKKMTTFLISIIESLNDWVIVIEKETGEVLYANESAKRMLYNPNLKKYMCGEECNLMLKLKCCINIDEEQDFEFTCPCSSKTLLVKSYFLEWENKNATVHMIKDVTYQKENETYLETIAYKDDLTGLHNRRSCLKNIDKLMKSDTPFSICMIDLDDLKYVNDQFGHFYGDEYIKTVATQLKQSIRDIDFVYRYGGDEFVVLLSNCKEKDAEEKMAMIDNKISSEQNGYPMSMSYGVVYVTKEINLPLDEIIHRADEKMYEFKRNRKKNRKKEIFS